MCVCVCVCVNVTATRFNGSGSDGRWIDGWIAVGVPTHLKA